MNIVEEVLWRVEYQIKEAARQIKYAFNPRQKWLIKLIPNQWCDKDWIIETVTLECFKHYVEQEIGGLSELKEYAKNQSDTPRWRQFYKEAVIRYGWLQRLNKLREKMKQAFEKVPIHSVDDITKGTYHEIYSDIDKLEKKIDDLETKILHWIIENRRFMWT